MQHLPPEYRELYLKGIHILHNGNLRNADYLVKLQYFIAWIGGYAILYFLLEPMTQYFAIVNKLPSLEFFLLPLLIMVAIASFYYWGWKQKYEAWIWFDHDSEILSVLSLTKSPSLYEIPYEEILSINWSGGKNGYAIIRTSAIDVRTNRAKDKNEGSITELWQTIAKIGAPFEDDWPIIMICPECGESFGHHTGTATCPFDENVSLYDLNSKGRVDPEEMAKEDTDRV